MTKALETAIRRAQALAPAFADHIDSAIRSADLYRPLLYVGSEDRLTMLKAIWAVAVRGMGAGLLAFSLANGDAPSRELAFVCKAMRAVRARGQLVIEGPEDQRYFDSLPQRIIAYRGTTQAEIDDAPFFGVSWTTEREWAEWFATEHGRFRRLDSPPVLLSQTIDKSDVAGTVIGRTEHELFIDPLVTSRSHKKSQLVISAIDPSIERPRPRPDLKRL